MKQHFNLFIAAAAIAIAAFSATPGYAAPLTQNPVKMELKSVSWISSENYPAHQAASCKNNRYLRFSGTLAYPIYINNTYQLSTGDTVTVSICEESLLDNKRQCINALANLKVEKDVISTMVPTASAPGVFQFYWGWNAGLDGSFTPGMSGGFMNHIILDSFTTSLAGNVPKQASCAIF